MTKLNFSTQFIFGQISQNLFILSKFRYHKACLRCQSKTFEIASHKVTPARHNCGCSHSPMCSDPKQCVLIKCESQELHNVSEQHSKDLWMCKVVKCDQSFITKCWSQECLFAWHKSWNCNQNFFLQNLQVENLQRASELHSKQLRFRMHKSWTCAHNFFHKPYRQGTSKMCQTSKQTPSFWDA